MNPDDRVQLASNWPPNGPADIDDETSLPFFPAGSQGTVIAVGPSACFVRMDDDDDIYTISSDLLEVVE